MPDDLRDWMDRHSLARLVLEAIQAATLPSAPATAMRGGNAGIRPHMLLSLLTYCYATGVHGSADIELISTQDPMVRHLCADIYPEAQVLRQFRRRNREAIRTCLAEVLRRAWAIQLSPGAGNPPVVEGSWRLLVILRLRELLNRVAHGLPAGLLTVKSIQR